MMWSYALIKTNNNRFRSDCGCPNQQNQAISDHEQKIFKDIFEQYAHLWV